ncbi:MAG: mechanosensitive ion channel, partial [Clostridia bacterium]|nr:mechanosensitive ion channel [Clostridia bacterium]
EGTFRVGDIVTVDNWRGEVVEIGLRSTNVKNELGNIKVFQNSRISGAINMTRDLTYAVCDIPLPAGEPLKAYEEKLTSEFFPIARENIRSIRPPIKYEGVVAINGDSATLRISVKCLESEREQIKRELYRELKLWREQKQASSE